MSARDRAPRRVGLPAGAHARLLRAGRAAGRRLHRARPRDHEGRRLVARHEPEISTTTDVADHPEFAGAQDDEAHRRRRGRPAGSRRTSRSPSSRRCARRSASRSCGRRTRPTTGSSRSRPSRRSSTCAGGSRRSSAGRSASTRRPSTRPTSASTGCRSRSRWCRRCAQRAEPQQRAGVRAVLRDRQPAGARRRAEVPLVQLLGAKGRALRLRRRRDPRTYADLRHPRA